MSSREKFLILGDGILGTEMQKQTGWNLISRKKDNFIIQKDSSYTNLPECTTIINCIAHTDTYSSEREDHWQTNYVGLHKLIEFCNSKGIKLVHIGTDFLYAGNKKESPTEDDVPVHAENWYAYTKLLGDGLVQLLSKKYLICRCSHKPHPFPFKKAYTNRISNVDYVDIIASLITELVLADVEGVYNVGTEKKSMYDLASRHYNVDPAIADGDIINTAMCVKKQNAILSNEKIYTN